MVFKILQVKIAAIDQIDQEIDELKNRVEYRVKNLLV